VARKGHAPQLSISDDNHHVTEVLGYMYDDDNNYTNKRESGLQNIRTHSPLGGSVGSLPAPATDWNTQNSPRVRGPPGRKMTDDQSSPTANGQVRPPVNRDQSWEKKSGTSSPPGLRSRAPSDTATTQFPLSDIDYESSPAAVAQELSNLQALRRMSMDVTATGDPDLPSLNAAAMPAAPSASDSEDDSSRLFWVPARLHPELAPKEFKSFLEGKADQIKRRSGELSSFASGEKSRSSSLSSEREAPGGLQRKKSMLSRQIDNSNGRGAEGYQDGAERLERKRSRSARTHPQDPNLEELETLVTDAVQLKRLSIENADRPGEDVILPSVPGQSLRRSTRTQYRRGSTKGQPTRLSYARRVGRSSAPDSADVGEDISSVPPIPNVPAPPPSQPEPFPGPLRSNTDPVAVPARTTNFSRPGGRSPSSSSHTKSESVRSFDSVLPSEEPADKSSASPQPQTRQWQSRLSSHGRSSLQIPPENQTIPKIVLEAPKSQEEEEEPQVRKPLSAGPSASTSIQNRLPERKSSREEARPISPPAQRPPIIHSSPFNSSRGMPPGSRNNQSLEQMSSHPSPLPGNDTNTSNLSFIPTLPDDKRGDDKKLKDVKKDDTRKSSWGWLLGKEESENRDKRLETLHSKPRAKISKPPEKYDNTRLDVLQNSIEGGKGRESLVLDRNNLKLEEERKKESARKLSGGDGKKEKDGLFSSIFGGGKKHKGDRDSGGKKYHSRGLSPDPPHKVLKPDVDYNWTRFSILEERAIYRMAHIKLANPRRALYSQVLLSNFMYSYLAKVQQMHPQMNLPTSAKQQKKQQQQSKEQPDEFTQYQRYQQVFLAPVKTRMKPY
jgi:Activator of mitotic machinery Cdc14 phosphatase activation C-term